MNPKNEGEKMEASLLKKRMATVNAIVTDKDLARLTNTPNIITSENYLELCKEYEADMEGHDPLVGAYKLLEDSNGNIDFNIVNDIFEAFGHETLKKKDIEILHEFLDVDRNGRINLEDFKRIFKHLGR